MTDMAKEHPIEVIFAFYWSTCYFIALTVILSKSSYSKASFSIAAFSFIYSIYTTLIDETIKIPIPSMRIDKK
jgi:hypothetical protein